MPITYAEVIPALRLPKKFEYFDYILPDELKNQVCAGSIVFIPFRGKNAIGLVLKTKNKTAYNIQKLKSIIRLTDEKLFLQTDLIKIIFWLKNFLGIPTSLALKTILPEIPTRPQRLRACVAGGQKEEECEISSIAKILPENNDTIKKIISSEQKLICVKWTKQNTKNYLIKKFIEKNNDKQIIILEPRLKNAFLTYGILKNTFGDIVEFYHKKLNKNSSFNLWKNTSTKKTKIIITTRAGIFFPMNDLGLIIFNDEEDADFKSANQNPYYDARTIAALRSKWSNAKLILLSQVPRTESFELSKRKNSFYELDRNEKPDISIVDISNSSFSGNSFYISESLEKNIANTLQNKKKVILFLNRKGESTYISCKDCGFVWKCDKCSRPLVEYKNKLRCVKCKTESKIPLVCAKCSNTNIRLGGIGTQKLEKEIRKIFPSKNITRVDKDSAEENIKNQELNNLQFADIIIGTEYLFKNYLYPYTSIKDIGLIAIPVVENLFSLPDFRTDEKAYGWIVKLKKLAINTNSKLIIQSFFPDNENISMACGDSLRFYKKELAERNVFLYPPFSVLLKIFKHTKIEYPIFIKIKGVAEKNKIQILEPLEKRKNKKIEHSILLKIPKNKTCLIPDFINLLDEKWNVDINPL